MSNAERVKQKIKKKFRTVARFAAIVGLDAMDIRKMLNSDPPSYGWVQKIDVMVESHKDKILPGEMTKDMRRAIIKKIDERGGVLTFNKNNPEFAVSTVYRVISGKVKRIDRKAAELIKHLGI